MADRPAAEVEVTEGLVRGLLAAQHPDLADLPLTRVAEGWDNAIWRLGTGLAVRVPRREIAARLVVREQRWLPVLAERLPAPVPVPVREGSPTPDYPWRWSVVEWFEGQHAIDLEPARCATLVEPLAGFVTALHTAAPDEAPSNPVRSVPLLARDEAVKGRLHAVPAGLRAQASALWSRAVAAPRWPGPRVWHHGDLHPGNLVAARDGSLSAVVDFGDLGAGDPAVDLAVAWSLFARADREQFVRLVEPLVTDDALWLRAHGWALSFATALLAFSDDNPLYRTLGERTLTAVLED